MRIFVIVMLIIAAVSFALVALGSTLATTPSSGVAFRVNFLGLGLLAWVLTILVPALFP